MEETSKGDEMLVVQTKLPKDLAKKFLQDCDKEDRDMSSMARHIIRKHYAQRELQNEMEKFKLFQKSQSGEIPHVSGDGLDLEQNAGM